MPLFGRRRHRATISNPARINSKQTNALTSSGFKVKRQDADVMRRLIQPWQARSFAYYDLIPEIKYAAQFYARLLSPLVLFPAFLDDNGDLVPTEDPEVVAALDRIQDPGGGRTGLLSSYGRLMFLTGECILFVTLDPETQIEQWEMLSTDELRIMQGVYLRYKAPSLIIEEFHEAGPDDYEPIDDDSAVAYRLWQRHPRWSMLADSTMMGVLDLCEELLLLTSVVRARGRSRLAGSGILLVDDRISPVPLEPVPDEDPDVDPFLSELTYAMTQPIVNEGSAAQMVPLVVRATAPEGGKIADLLEHVRLVNPTELYPETGLRYELVKRIAVGLDMPPEELLGLADVNHWTGWMIDEQTWKAHGQQKAQQLCDDLTSAYLRPYLRDELGRKDWADFAVAYDAAAVINHPDRTTDAKDLYNLRVIGKAAVRRVADFDEDDAPTEQELAEIIGVQTHDSSLAWNGTPSAKAGGVEVAPGEIVSAQAEGAEGTALPPQTNEQSTGASTEKGPPSSGDGGSGAAADAAESARVGSARMEGLVARVVGASDLALLRAREAAGARLVTLARRNKDLAPKLKSVPTRQVAYVLGPEVVRSLKVSEQDLIASAAPLVQDALRMYGVNDQRVKDAVVRMIEQHATRTLYDRDDPGLPDSFTAIVRTLIANGNGHGGS